MQITTPSARIKAQIKDKYGEITFTYQERHNILDLEAWQALPDIMAQMANTEDMRLLILRGAGESAFVAGADITQFDTAFAGAAATEYEQATADAFSAIAACPIPTLAAIQGYCIGGGLAIAAACDLRLAQEGSTFSIPAARLGLAYPPNATLQLKEIVGAAQAKHILFTAARFDCAAAQAMGLLTATTSPENFEETLATFITQITSNAPLTLQTAKYILDTPNPSPTEIKKRVAFCLNSDDYKEGRNAFKEKRTPQFKGD